MGTRWIRLFSQRISEHTINVSNLYSSFPYLSLIGQIPSNLSIPHKWQTSCILSDRCITRMRLQRVFRMGSRLRLGEFRKSKSSFFPGPSEVIAHPPGYSYPLCGKRHWQGRCRKRVWKEPVGCIWVSVTDGTLNSGLRPRHRVLHPFLRQDEVQG